MNVGQQMINITASKQKLIMKGQTGLLPRVIFSSYTKLIKICTKGNVTS